MKQKIIKTIKECYTRMSSEEYAGVMSTLLTAEVLTHEEAYLLTQSIDTTKFRQSLKTEEIRNKARRTLTGIDDWEEFKQVLAAYTACGLFTEDEMFCFALERKGKLI